MDEPFFSKRYEPPTIDLENKNISHTLAIDLIGFDKRVLEIGTSTGYVSKILKARGNIITGIEIDREAGLIAEQYCAQVIIGDVEDLDLDSVIEASSFDVILCGDVLEHLKNPGSLLKNLRKFLKPGGYLVISLPNFFHADVLLNLLFGDFRYTPIGLLDRTHLRFFGLKNIYQLFAESGYQITDIHTANTDLGTTELKINLEKVPQELIKFLRSLPNSTVYQYVFTAHPSAHATLPDFVDADLQKIFFSSLETWEKKFRDEITLISEKNHLLSAANLSLHDELSELKISLSSVSEKNHLLSAANLSLHDELTSVKTSITWQLVTKFHQKIIERFFSQGTKRRKFYDLCRAGGKILVNEGFQTFHYSFDRFVHKDKKLNGYQLWIEKNEPRREDVGRIKKEVQNFSYLPKISIISPIWNTDEKWLRLAIESVINQIYDNWELCIVDGGSTRPHIKKVLNEYAGKDSRIKVKFLEENKGIAGNSNEALALATGDFVGFLDHDDELAPFSLYEVVKLLNQHQNLHFIYSDEDKMNEKGVRKDAFFKPDWSPDMFLSHNYLCHFSVIRRSLVDAVGRFRNGYDGSQDYDLFLRVTEKISDKEISHIPKILYHWRMIEGSAAYQSSAKPYAFISAKKALKDALIRRGILGEVSDGLFPSSYRIRYTIQNYPKISIIIPTKDKVEILQKCVLSILEKTSYQNYEIVITDNQSVEQKTFDYYENLKNNTKVRLLTYDKPFNFSAINNYAVSQVESPYVLLLNNDTEVISEEWLTAMLEHAQRKDVGAVGAKLLYPGNTIQHAGIIVGIIGNPPVGGHLHRYLPDYHPGYFGRASHIQNVSAITAACMMMRKEVFEEVGGFDENLAVAFNDVDLCLKIREKAYLIIYTPYAKLFHHESLSRGYEDSPEKQKRFVQEVHYLRTRWGDVIDRGDPYYNENLTKKKEDFSFE